MFRSTEIDGFFCPNKICSKRKIDSRTNILCVLRQCDGHSRGDDIAVEDRSMKFEPEDHRENMSKIESIQIKVSSLLGGCASEYLPGLYVLQFVQQLGRKSERYKRLVARFHAYLQQFRVLSRIKSPRAQQKGKKGGRAVWRLHNDLKSLFYTPMALLGK